MRNRIIALLLACVMTVSLLPVSALAVEPSDNNTAAQETTVITTAEEFAAMKPDGAYRLGADITVDAPYDKTFTGSLDGAYHTVTLALHVTADDTDASWGLFRALNGAAIRDLRLTGELAAAEDSPAKNVGALAGTVSGDTTVSGCRSEVQISVSSADSHVGGLVGSVTDGTLSLTGCADAGAVKALKSAAAGGLLGSVLSGSVTIQRSYQSGDVLGGVCTGGLMGQLAEQAECTAAYSYAAVSSAVENTETSALPGWGEVRTVSGEKVGALCGQGTFSAESKALFWSGKAFETDTALAGGRFEETDTNTVLAALNDGTAADDPNGFLLTKENGGWPLLRWELTQPQAPDTELDSKKEALKSQLAEVWSQYREASYEPENWAALTKLYNDALAAIAAARTAEELPLLSELMTDMAAIPAKIYTELMAEEKQSAIRRIQALYEKYLKQLEEKEAAFEESSRGVWLSLTLAGREQLDAAREALEQQQATALAALNDCKTTAEVDALAENCEAAMQKILEDLQVAVQDNDVPEENKWDGKTTTQPASGSGAKDDPYLIGTGAELAWFADQVKNGSVALCARLTAEIDLNGHPWTPIGTAAKSYQGMFDGCNSTVHGLHISDKSYAGLFGVIGKSGIVERLKVAGTISIVSVSGNGVDNVGAGGIAGYCMGTVFQCSSSVNISNDGTNYSAVAGGIAGKAAVNAIIDSCNSYGTVGSRNNINYAGGIVGAARQSTMIRYCTNEGAVNGVQGVGGIVGLLTDYAQVRLCENKNTIQGDSRVGGIVGWVCLDKYISGSVLDVIIMNVLNKGAVSGSGSPAMGYGAGGIVGYIDTANNTGLTGPCTLSYAYNTGNVTDNGDATAQGVGGIVGEWYSGEIRHVQSASANTLWGVVDVANTNSHDAARVSCVTPSFTMASGSWDKVSATAQLLAKLIRPGDENYKVYGPEQSILYNGIVLSYIERIELADGDADALVQECEEQLAAVLSGTDAGGEQLLADLRAYVDSRVYAAEEQAEVNALLAAAEEEIKNADTIAKINEIRQDYLGEDGKLLQIITYPKKAQRDLYNRFITNKKYSQEDMATLLAAYESWKLKLDQAASAEEVDILYADAGKALTDLTATFTEGDTAPDMDAAAAAALQKARDAARQELDTLAQQRIAELTTQLGDISGFDKEHQTLLNDALERGKATIETAAAVELDELTDYAAIEQARQEGLTAIEQAYTSASGKLKKLLDSARAEDGWDGTPSQPHGTGTEDDPYQIGTAQELAWLAYAVNNQMESAGYCAVLTADIDLGYCRWPVIGILSSNGQRAYTGTFDGQGHTVSGLYITSLGGRQKLGLFGVAQDAVIENLTVRGSIELTGVKSYDMTAGYIIGGLLGSGEVKDGKGVTIRNCVSQVDISVSFVNDQKAQRASVSGLVGRLSGSGSHEITDCRNEGRVYTSFEPGAYYLGGFGGDGGQGGIVGFIDASARLERCVNTGTVYAGRAAGVGGIVGNAGANGVTITLNQCANQGAVSNDIGGALLRKGGTGGIIGLAPTGSITVSSCYNTGVVAGSAIVGGILGGEKGEHSSSQYGNKNLTLENCYNAGALQVGTATTLVGSLAGYPIDGQYYTGLTVRKGACRFVMGWKCSQGDSVKESTTLTADSLFEGLVDSIGGVNSGYPLFDWQLLEQRSREEVVSYLSDRYEREIKPIATAAQCEEIEKLLAEAAETIRTAETTAEMTAAYEKVLGRMSADDLLAAAKEAALKQLDKLYGSAKKNYKDITEQLDKLYETQTPAIEACTKSADTDTVLDQFSAGVVDLLIRARVKTGMTIKELSSTLPEVTAAYKELTAAQKTHLANGKKLTDAQNLLATYERDLESLNQWVDSDTDKYSAVKTEIGKLATETRTKLEGCTDAAGMAKVLNDYSAGVARLLLEKLNFTAGKTTLGELNKLSQVIEQASAAISGLTKEQKELLDEAQVASCAAAKELLAVYTKAVENLNKWSSEDQNKYTDLKTPLNSLAATARKELESSVDKDGAAKALNGYCAGVVMELIRSVGTVKTVMTEQEAAQVKSKIQRAQAAYGNLSDDQKKLVTNYAALQAAGTAYKTYEQNYAAAKTVIDLIKDIGKVNEGMTRTEADTVKKKIQTAQDAYNKLTSDQKKMVTNYADLQAATAAYQTYETNYAAAKAAEDLIKAIGTVTKDSYDAIQKATEAYNKLTVTQKKLVDAKLVQQLQDASARYKELLEQTTGANGEKVPTDQLLVPDEVQTEDTQPFDWSIVWISLGILAAAGVITFVIRWFIAMRRAKQKKEA
ncbi:MAG: hypothetical protein U0O27_09970 [Oscillospiraceae bacterium]